MLGERWEQDREAAGCSVCPLAAPRHQSSSALAGRCLAHSLRQVQWSDQGHVPAPCPAGALPCSHSDPGVCGRTGAATQLPQQGYGHRARHTSLMLGTPFPMTVETSLGAYRKLAHVTSPEIIELLHCSLKNILSLGFCSITNFVNTLVLCC